jgi:hypothetical protein
MKKMFFTLLVLQMIFCGLINSPAQALPLGSFDINSTSGSRANFDQIKLLIGFGGDWLDYFSGAVLDYTLSSDSKGQTFSVSSGTEFNEAATKLTNGVNNFIGYKIYGYPTGGSVGASSFEAQEFFGDYTGAHGIDFAGSEITSIDLNVHNLNFNHSGGNWTDVTFNATVAINGIPVPEPATLYMLCIGFIGLILYRSIRRRW